MTVEEVLSQPIVQRLGWTLVHFVWQGIAVAVFFGIVMSVIRRRTANSRYVAACAALLLMLVLPPVTMQTIRFTSPSAVIVEPARVVPPALDTPPPIPSVSPSFRSVEYEPISLPPEVAVVRPSAPDRLRWRRRASELFEPMRLAGRSAGLVGAAPGRMGARTTSQTPPRATGRRQMA